MNNCKRFVRNISNINRLGKIPPDIFKNIKLRPQPITNTVKKAQLLPSEYLYDKIRIETKINKVRIVNFNGSQLLLNNVYVLSGFSQSSLEELLDNKEDDE